MLAVWITWLPLGRACTKHSIKEHRQARLHRAESSKGYPNTAEAKEVRAAQTAAQSPNDRSKIRIKDVAMSGSHGCLLLSTSSPILACTNFGSQKLCLGSPFRNQEDPSATVYSRRRLVNKRNRRTGLHKPIFWPAALQHDPPRRPQHPRWRFLDDFRPISEGSSGYLLVSRAGSWTGIDFLLRATGARRVPRDALRAPLPPWEETGRRHPAPSASGRAGSAQGPTRLFVRVRAGARRDPARRDLAAPQPAGGPHRHGFRCHRRRAFH